MTRQVRTLIVLTVAIAAAGLASFAVYRAVSQLPQRKAQIPLKKAVVAATAMPTGTLLTRESLKVVDWPANSPLEGGFSKVEDVVNRGLITPVVANEPLSEIKLAPREAGAGLPPTIQPGMRAISVRVNEVIGVAGFVVPGTHVDVVTIIGDPDGRKNDPVSRVVVSNVQVLTAGTRYDQEESRKDGKPIRSTVVTLMVSPLDAERIALAQSEGDLFLTLRHPLDVDPTNDGAGIRKAALFADPPKPAAPPAASKPRAPRPPVPAVVPVVETVPVKKPYTVETIRAAKRSEEKLADIIAVP